MTDKKKIVDKKATKKPAKKKAIVVAEKKPLYKKHNWKGLVPIFQCLICNHCENEESKMKKHVHIHEVKE